MRLCAQNPAMIGDFVNELGQTDWHDSVHRDLALVLLDVVSKDSSLNVADLIQKAQEQCPYAQRILTSSSVPSDSSAFDLLRFMADELKIGDMEQAIAAMRSQMNTASSAEESELAFQSILVLQSELNTLRKHHVKNN